jgi:peptidoglycan/LPS O-acetylase OafA/YrhL
VGAVAGNERNEQRPGLGQVLVPSRNSLNVLRLVLAVAVIISHSFAFTRFGRSDDVNGTSLGTIAVYGFFAISGYLIAGSALRSNGWRYLWQRFLRIFPAFRDCLIGTGLVFGFLAYVANSQHCPSYTCYLKANPSPLGYVYHNWILRINQSAIGNTPQGRYVRSAWYDWNISLRTLFYEFLCYLALLAMAVVGLLRRRIMVLSTSVILFGAIATITFDSHLAAQFSVFHYWVPMNLMKFGMIFLVGASLFLYRDKAPDSGWISLVEKHALTLKHLGTKTSVLAPPAAVGGLGVTE